LCLSLANLSYLVMISSNALAATGQYRRSVGSVSDQYPVVLTPASYTFFIWYVIFALTFIFLITLNFRTLRRPGSRSGGFYFFLAVFVINMLLNAAWPVLWSLEWLIPSAVVLFGISLTCGILYLTAYHNLTRNARRLSRVRHNASPSVIACPGKRLGLLLEIVDLSWISIYWAWTTLAFLINLLIVLKYETNLLTNCPTAATCQSLSLNESYFGIGFLCLVGLVVLLVLIGFSSGGFGLTIAYGLTGLLVKLLSSQSQFDCHSDSHRYYNTVILTTVVVLVLSVMAGIIGMIGGLVYSRGFVWANCLRWKRRSSRISPGGT
jgi:hypothetical protein